jgi:hypothetical protein
VAFGGQGSGGQHGIYTSFGGTLSVLANTNTPVPSGTGNFADFGAAYTSGGFVGFRGFDSLGNAGVYTNVGGLRAVADTNTPVPGTCLSPANFIDLTCGQGFASQKVTFCGKHPSGLVGIFTDIGGPLSVIADTCTAIPGGTGNFTNFDIWTPFNGSAAAFIGFGSGGQTGVYSNVGGLHVIADTNTPIPGGVGNFTSFYGLTLDGANVAFVGFGSNDQTGVYTNVNGLHLVADTNTPIPGGTGSFQGFIFFLPALRNGHVVFNAYGTSGQSGSGLYTDRMGSLTKIIAAGDTLDGKTVTGPSTGPRPLDGDQLVVNCYFADSSSGVYLLTLAGATPPSQALNLSTRLNVGTGDNLMIGGFIITGTGPKAVVLRGMGPSLAGSGISNFLADPVLELRDSSGALIRKNDNWKDDQRNLIEGTVFQPTNDNESVIVATLDPGAYTALLTGKDQTTGVGLVEIYDHDTTASSELGNISTRGFVQTGNNVLIGGFILGNNTANATIAVRGRGPSLTQLGLSPVLADPTLEIHNSNGSILISNDDWETDPVSAAQLTANGLAPSDPKESGIFTTLPPGQFTAILAGKVNGVGIGVVEIYNLK